MNESSLQPPFMICVPHIAFRPEMNTVDEIPELINSHWRRRGENDRIRKSRTACLEFRKYWVQTRAFQGGLNPDPGKSAFFVVMADHVDNDGAGQDEDVVLVGSNVDAVGVGPREPAFGRGGDGAA